MKDIQNKRNPSKWWYVLGVIVFPVQYIIQGLYFPVREISSGILFVLLVPIMWYYFAYICARLKAWDHPHTFAVKFITIASVATILVLLSIIALAIISVDTFKTPLP